jgi:DNA-binding protein Fis
MKEQIISFETAKLAKEKGFESVLLTYYDSETEELQPITATVRQTLKSSIGSPYGQNTRDDYEAVLSDMDNSLDEFILAPTQSLLQKWLREECKIYIELSVQEAEVVATWYWKIFTHRESGKGLIWIKADSNGVNNDTYEEALEIALQEALNLIK